jgi:hypothetical protein
VSPADAVEARPNARRGGRRLDRLATAEAELNIRLFSRLAEAAVTSGDIKTAVEAVRACTTEAEHVYQIAVAERSAAANAARAAAEQHARAIAMQEAAAEQYARAVSMQEAAAAQHARSMMLQAEATAQHGRAMSLREEAVALHDEACAAMAEVEAQRKADRRRMMSVPRRLRVSDANGLDLRPDPSAATTPEEYIDSLRQFRLWAGNPSFRDLAKRCNGRPVASTICKVLQSGELPRRFEVIDAIVSACGGTEEDRARFATAWRQLVLPGRKARSALRVVPRTLA